MLRQVFWDLLLLVQVVFFDIKAFYLTLTFCQVLILFCCSFFFFPQLTITDCIFFRLLNLLGVESVISFLKP